MCSGDQVHDQHRAQCLDDAQNKALRGAQPSVTERPIACRTDEVDESTRGLAYIARLSFCNQVDTSKVAWCKGRLGLLHPPRLP